MVRDLTRYIAPTLGILALVYAAFVTLGVAPATPQERAYRTRVGPWPYDLYRPRTDHAAPLVIIVHGGGGIRGDRDDRWPTQLASRLAADGFLVASIDYRLAPEWPWPAPVEDVRAAITALRFEALRAGADPGPVFVIGLSAGALFAELAVLDRPHSVAGIVSVAGVHDLNALDRPWVDVLLGDTDRRAASPVHQVTAEFPPALLLHGDQDALVPIDQSVAMRDALHARGCDVTFVPIAGGNHFVPEDDFLSACYPRIRAWLRERA